MFRHFWDLFWVAFLGTASSTNGSSESRPNSGVNAEASTMRIGFFFGGGPYYNYNYHMVYPQALFYLLRPLQYT